MAVRQGNAVCAVWLVPVAAARPEPATSSVTATAQLCLFFNVFLRPSMSEIALAQRALTQSLKTRGPYVVSDLTCLLHFQVLGIYTIPRAGWR